MIGRARAKESLDQMDLMLIRELEIDARQKLASIAVKLGTTPVTIHRKFHRLLEQRVIRVTAKPDPWALGYAAYSALAINVLPEKARDTIDRLAAVDEFQHIALTGGRYDIISWVISRDFEDLLRLISESLAGMSGVTGIEVFSALKFIKSSWTYLELDDHPNLAPRWRPDRELDSMDLAIISQLQGDPRQPVVELARKLNVHRSMVDRKLKMLQDENAIRIVSMVDPAFLGYQLSMPVLVKVRPDMILTVAEQLSALWNIRSLSVISGSHQIHAWAVFQDPSQMSHFMRVELSGLPGILAYEVLPVLSIPKVSFSIPVKGDSGR